MAQQTLDLQLRGLFTSPNNLSGVPQGALEIANNVVLDTKNIISSRRGQTQYGAPLVVGSGEVNKIFNYASSLILNYDDKMAYDSGSGVWVDYSGTYDPPANDFKMRSLEALKNFYFNTEAGIFKIDALTSTPRRAGVVKALGGTAALTGSSGFLVEDTAVAYRMVWGYVDANNNLLLGAPSQRLVVVNPSGSGADQNVNLTYPIPDSITTEYFYQIYRSNATLTAIDEPSDELQLVIQGNVSAAEITAKSFTVLDQTPYSLMRATLYTSPSQEGIANENSEPPFALDMDVFKTCAFYANIRQKQTLLLSLVGVQEESLSYVADTGDTTNASPAVINLDTQFTRVGMRVIGTGIPSNTYVLTVDSPTQVTLSKNATATNAGVSLEFQDRLTLANVDYWAGTTQSTVTNTFILEKVGTASQTVQETSLNLLTLVNTTPSNTAIYGYYISALEDIPGNMVFEERAVGGSVFTASSTAGSSFQPILPATVAIQSNTVASPTVVFAINHGLITGNVITITGSNSTPSIDGEYTVTVVSPNSFRIPVNVTIAGTSGSFLKTSLIVSSSSEAKQNRVLISKPGQVEAVPTYRFFNVGSENFPITRVVSLRDGIFFFKNDGIYRLSGETFESFSVSLVDNTVTLKVPESAVPFNNQVFCMTTQGICAVTDSGVKIMSVAIENTLLELSSEQFTNFVSSSFGVAYESARQYMFFTVAEMDDTFARQAFVYNSLTDSWTKFVMDRTCGVVNTSINKLFMAQAETGQIMIERKSYTNADYADEQYNVVIASVDSLTQVTLVSASLVVAGMTLVQGFRQAYIESVNGNILTITRTLSLTTGAAIVYTPIDNFIQWAPIDCENPGILKQFSEISLFFRNAAFREIDAGFSSNVSIGNLVVPLTKTNASGGWGNFPWGEEPWGGALAGQAVLRTYVPREKQRASWIVINLRTQEAFTGFSLQGISLIFNSMSSRIK